MSQYKTLTTNQEKYLLKAVKKIYKEYVSGVGMVYQWNLQNEIKFLNEILSMRTYSLQYDSDRLNSIKNLVGYIERQDYTIK